MATINLLLERHRGNDELWIRGPKAWYALQKDAMGRNTDRECDLQRLIYNPARAKTWSDVPAAIDEWESLVEEYDTIAETGVPTRAKLVILPNLLPETWKRRS